MLRSHADLIAFFNKIEATESHEALWRLLIDTFLSIEPELVEYMRQQLQLQVFYYHDGLHDEPPASFSSESGGKFMLEFGPYKPEIEVKHLIEMDRGTELGHWLFQAATEIIGHAPPRPEPTTEELDQALAHAMASMSE